MGKRFSCPRCGALITVPGGTGSPAAERQRPAASTAPCTTHQMIPSQPGGPRATGIGRLLTVLVVIWACFIPVSLLLASLLPLLTYPIFLALGAVTILFVAFAARMIIAKRQVLVRKEVDLLFGFIKFISWDPTEAVLILKNKAVSYVDDNLYDGGGIRIIYPGLGEELVCRAPLEIQTLAFENQDVLTREYLPLTVQGTIKWRIIDLQRFYLLLSQEVNLASPRGSQRATGSTGSYSQGHDDSPPERVPGSFTSTGRKVASALQWLQYMAEEQTRAVVSKISTGLLIAERVAANLPPDMREQVEGKVLNPIPLTPSSSAQYQSATEGLSAAIDETVADRVKEFGIGIHEVTLQEIRLPSHIYEAAVEACKAAYLPLIAQKEALGRKMQLQAEADVLGAETVAAREIVGKAPAFALSDFLSTFLANNRAMIEAKGKADAYKLTDK